MTTTTQSSPRRGPSGFTLMETVIAIGIVALLLSSFLTVFGPANQNIQRSLQATEATRVAKALEKELSVVHVREESRYPTVVHKVFDFVSKGNALPGGNGSSSPLQDGIYVYSYRGRPGDVASSGSLEPYTSSGANLGVVARDFSVVAVARTLQDESIMRDELEALVGRVFYVRLVPMQETNDGLTINRQQKPVVTWRGQPVSNPDNYSGAGVKLRAEFYDLPTTAVDYLLGGYPGPTIDDTPVHTVNLNVLF